MDDMGIRWFILHQPEGLSFQTILDFVAGERRDNAVTDALALSWNNFGPVNSNVGNSLHSSRTGAMKLEQGHVWHLNARVFLESALCAAAGRERLRLAQDFNLLQTNVETLWDLSDKHWAVKRYVYELKDGKIQAHLTDWAEMIPVEPGTLTDSEKQNILQCAPCRGYTPS
jgi:hypothetical protein